MTHEFCSIFIWHTVKQRRSQHISLVQTKFNMSTLCFDNNRQSFWQLINRLVQRVLASLSPGVNQNLLKLISVWNFVTIDHLLQRSPQPTRTRFTAGNSQYVEPWCKTYHGRTTTLCSSRTERLHTVHATLSLSCVAMCLSSVNRLIRICRKRRCTCLFISLMNSAKWSTLSKAVGSKYW